MIVQKLNILSEVDFMHSFFPGGLLPLGQLKFYFSNDIDPAIYHIQEKESGLIIYNSKSNDLSQHNPSIIFMGFTAADFPNYTDIRIKQGYINYYGITSTEKAFTHQDLPLHKKTFTYPLSEAQKQDLKQLTLLLPNGSSLKLPLYEKLEEVGYRLDLSYLMSGYYELHLSFKTLPEISYAFIAASLPLSDLPFGAIALPTYYSNSTEQTLVLNLQARATYWRYFFPKTKERDWEGYEIKPVKISGDTLTFHKNSTPILLPNSEYAYEFTSDKPIFFEERPSFKVILTTPDFPEGIQLAYAEPNILYLLENNHTDPSYCSNIYVNI